MQYKSGGDTMNNQLLLPFKISDEVTKQVEEAFVSIAEKVTDDVLNGVKAKPYMNKREACEYIGVSFNTLVKFQNAGLPIVNVDGIQMFRKIDIDNFFKENVQ